MTFIIKKQGTLLRNHEWTSVELKCGRNIVKYLSQNIQKNKEGLIAEFDINDKKIELN